MILRQITKEKLRKLILIGEFYTAAYMLYTTILSAVLSAYTGNGEKERDCDINRKSENC